MKYLTLIIITMSVVFASTNEASALSEFKKAFEKKYAKEIAKTKDTKSAFKKAGCYVCHVKKPKGFTGKVGKDAQNEYGQLLNELVKGSAKERKAKAAKVGKDEATKVKAQVLEEFIKAMDKVAEMKSSGGKGPKFSAKIKEGKLPIEVDKASAEYVASLKKKKEAEAKKKTDEAAKEEKAAS